MTREIAPAARLALAEALQTARSRAGLSRSELAAKANLHTSVLSRLERGEYPHSVTPETLKRLSDALKCDDRLFLAAGAADPQARELLAPLGRAFARSGDPAVRAGLRRIELAGIAAEFETQGFSPGDTYIDVDVLLAAVHQSRGQPVNVHYGGRDPDIARRRFWRAHAAAHALLDVVCDWPRVLDREKDVNLLAGLLIAPTRLVTLAVQAAAIPADQEIWDPGCADLVRVVAERLIVPGWVALRRIADVDGLDYLLPIEES